MKKFGGYNKNTYLCSVKISVFDYPVNILSECREGQALIDTTQFKRVAHATLLSYVSLHENLIVFRAQRKVASNRDYLFTF